MYDVFPRSEHWYIENGIAYFIDTYGNRLCSYNFTSITLSILGDIPLGEGTNISYSVCVKYENSIFCFPYKGMDILIFDIDKKIWSVLEVRKDDLEYLGIMGVGKVAPYLYAYMVNINDVMILNLETKKYSFWESSTLLEGSIYEFFFENNILYSFPVCLAKCIKKYIHIWNLADRSKRTLELPHQIDRLDTISFDGEFFWISKPKEVYRWNPITHELIALHNFPSEFKIKSSPQTNGGKNVPSGFTKAIFLQRQVWFVPHMSNPICVLNVNTEKWKLLRIGLCSLTKKEMVDKPNQYIVQYIREGRYIGLWIKASEQCIEIDTKRLSVRPIYYRLELANSKSLRSYIFSEMSRIFDRFIYKELVAQKEVQRISFGDIGTSIYKQILKV